MTNFNFIIEKCRIVWRNFFFAININSWKFQVSTFTHIRIPFSQFWFSSWGNNPAAAAHNHSKNEAIYSATGWIVIHTSIRIETVEFLYDKVIIPNFSKISLIVKIQILNTPVFNCVLLISTFAFSIEKYYIVWRSCFFTINANSWKF